MSGALRVLGGSAHPGLVAALAEALGTEPVPVTVERFADGERRPAVGDVAGDDVAVVVPVGPPVAEHLVELLLLDACRRSGAARVTAVCPYLAYLRQDRRTQAGHGIGMRVVLDALAAAGAQRLVVVDPHVPTVEAVGTVPVVALSAVPVLAGVVAPDGGPDGTSGAGGTGALAPGGGPGGPVVVVAPDLGAVRLAEAVAARLHAQVAVVRKARDPGGGVRALELVGHVAGARAVVVDDMIATGATIAAAVGALRSGGCAGDPTVLATHGLFVGRAADVFARLGVDLVVTDSLPATARVAGLRVRSLVPLLADALGRLHAGRPVDDLGAVG